MVRCLATLLLLSGVLFPAFAQRPQAQVPASATEVIERLPRGYSSLRPPAKSTTGRPANPIVAAEQLLQAAGRTGDTRLAARADALLATIPDTQASVHVRKSQAYSAQHRHDFALSLKLLNAIVQEDPRDPDARLARAQLHLVQGRIRAARADCAALVLTIDIGSGSVCVAALSLRTGDLPHAAKFADSWLAQPGAAPSLRRFMLVMRGDIAARAHRPDADTWFRQALVLAPDDVRTLSAYARYLNGAGRPRDTLALLANAPDADGLQLQHALAARASGAGDARRLADAQARRYALAREVGMEPELRDEAELALTLRGDAAHALELAQRNFEAQRDYEDVDLLQRAALAAKRPDALKTLKTWAKQEAVTLSTPESGR